MDALVDTENPSDATALRCALGYVEEWAVVVESRRLNTQRGIAPSSEAVLEQLESNRQKAPQLLRGPPRSFGGSARKRVHRLRARWHGRHGSIPVGERLSSEDAMLKSMNSGNIGSDFPRNVLQNFCTASPYFRARFRARLARRFPAGRCSFSNGNCIRARQASPISRRAWRARNRARKCEPVLQK